MGAIAGVKRGKHKKTTKRIGERYLTENYGWIEVIEYNGFRDVTVRFDDTGAIKSGLNITACMNGRVADDSLPRAQLITTRHPIGKEFKMSDGDIATVLSINSSTDVEVLWKSTNMVTRHSVQQLKSGRIKPRNRGKQYGEWNYLKVNEDGYYVYMCYINNRLVYVGKGTKQRYLHPNSGRSSVIEFNAMFFLGRTVDVKIYKDSLTAQEAKSLEKSITNKLKPPFNRSNI
jgi:hypothetical protein